MASADDVIPQRFLLLESDVQSDVQSSMPQEESRGKDGTRIPLTLPSLPPDIPARLSSSSSFAVASPVARTASSPSGIGGAKPQNEAHTRSLRGISKTGYKRQELGGWSEEGQRDVTVGNNLSVMSTTSPSSPLRSPTSSAGGGGPGPWGMKRSCSLRDQ